MFERASARHCIIYEAHRRRFSLVLLGHSRTSDDDDDEGEEEKQRSIAHINMNYSPAFCCLFSLFFLLLLLSIIVYLFRACVLCECVHFCFFEPRKRKSRCCFFSFFFFIFAIAFSLFHCVFAF